MNDESSTVCSELYSEFNYATNCEPKIKNNSVSKFPFKYPPKEADVDEDGDLVVQRRSDVKEFINAVEIEHSSNTILGLVGLQVWRGALLLADWLLDNGKNFQKGIKILELGSGTGLTSIIASLYAPVICTDVNKGEILNLINNNIVRNKHITKYPITVSEIDFTKESLPPDILSLLPEIKIVLAADVIYDNQLTEAFVRTVRLILSQQPLCSIYVAIEKRYVFTIADCDVVAPCYEFFLECLNLEKFVVNTVTLDFPQYFQYNRVKELTLCRISSNVNK